MELDARQRDFLQVLAYFYMSSGEFEKAYALLVTLKRLFPSNLEISASLGFAAVTLANYATALDEAEFILGEEHRENKTQFQGLYIRSRALWGLGKQNEARPVFDELIKLDRDEKG